MLPLILEQNLARGPNEHLYLIPLINVLQWLLLLPITNLVVTALWCVMAGKTVTRRQRWIQGGIAILLAVPQLFPSYWVYLIEPAIPVAIVGEGLFILLAAAQLASRLPGKRDVKRGGTGPHED